MPNDSIDRAIKKANLDKIKFGTLRTTSADRLRKRSPQPSSRPSGRSATPRSRSLASPLSRAGSGRKPALVAVNTKDGEPSSSRVDAAAEVPAKKVMVALGSKSPGTRVPRIAVFRWLPPTEKLADIAHPVGGVLGPEETDLVEQFLDVGVHPLQFLCICKFGRVFFLFAGGLQSAEEELVAEDRHSLGQIQG